MKLPSELGTWIFVTVVTLLIWFWAAGETRVTSQFDVELEFTVSGREQWTITPRRFKLSVELAGPNRAIQQASRSLNELLYLRLDDEIGSQQIDDLLDRLNEHPKFARDIGAEVISVDPPSIRVTTDRIIESNARVDLRLNDEVETEGDIHIEPRDVTISYPSTFNTDDSITVRAQLSQSQMDRLRPGIQFSDDVLLQPLPHWPRNSAVVIEPMTARVTFTPRSRLREIQLPSIRVDLSGPPEDAREYMVDLAAEHLQLEDVTIRADARVIDSIRDGSAKVVAVLSLGSLEKTRVLSQGATTSGRAEGAKHVSMFKAKLPDGREIAVEAFKDGQIYRPQLRYFIQERDTASTLGEN